MWRPCLPGTGNPASGGAGASVRHRLPLPLPGNGCHPGLRREPVFCQRKGHHRSGLESLSAGKGRPGERKRPAGRTDRRNDAPCHRCHHQGGQDHRPRNTTPRTRCSPRWKRLAQRICRRMRSARASAHRPPAPGFWKSWYPPACGAQETEEGHQPHSHADRRFPDYRPAGAASIAALDCGMGNTSSKRWSAVK